jgi:hypothetical protein
MIVNRLQKDLINSCKCFKAKPSKKKFQIGTHIFFSNSDRDLYSENNSVSQI